MSSNSLGSVQSSAAYPCPTSIGDKEGYDVTFKTPLIVEFICGLCQFALRWPQQARCGCRFCNCCIHRYAERADAKQFLCPNCKEEDININEMNPDNFARKKIDNSVIFCSNKSSGCTSEFVLKELKSHLEQCPFEMVECMHKEHGCVAKMARRDYMKHLKIDCHFRVATCDHSGEEITIQERKTHEGSCKMQPIAGCPNKCGVINIPQNKLQEHLKNDCTKESSDCKFSSYGCRFKGFPKEMKEHIVKYTDLHLEMVTKFTAQLELKYAESIRMVTEQQSKMNVMETKQEETEKELKDIKDKSQKNEKLLFSLQRMVAKRLDGIGDLEKKLMELSNKDDVSELRALLISEQDAVKDLRGKLKALEDCRFVGVSVTGTTGSGAAQLNNFHSRITTLDKDVGLHSVRLVEQDLRFQILETVSYDGVLIWKIKDFAQRKRDADSGKTLSLYSQPFYTSSFGYKMCARVYLNGDGMGKGSHVSLLFVVMKGDYDALLPWPFRQKVTLMLLDQENGRRHLSDSFHPDPASSSFKRPATDMNIADGCPLFLEQTVLQDGIYVKDDTVFFKILVDVSDLFV